MINYNEMYKSYVQKCKELGVVPSSRDKMFGKEILLQKQEQRVSITALSQAKKQKAPVLSEMAKEALTMTKKPRAKIVKAAQAKKATTTVKTSPVKSAKPKRALLTEGEKQERLNARARKYYHQNKTLKPRIVKPKAVKPTRVLLTEEQKKENARESARKYYENNKEKALAGRKKRYENEKAQKPLKPKLTDEEKIKRLLKLKDAGFSAEEIMDLKKLDLL